MNWLTRLVSVKVLVQALTAAAVLILANLDMAAFDEAPGWVQAVAAVVIPLIVARQTRETAPSPSAVNAAVRLGLARPLFEDRDMH